MPRQKRSSKEKRRSHGGITFYPTPAMAKQLAVRADLRGISISKLCIELLTEGIWRMHTKENGQ